MTDRAYKLGFIYKCAEYGIDPYTAGRLCVEKRADWFGNIFYGNRGSNGKDLGDIQRDAWKKVIEAHKARFANDPARLAEFEREVRRKELHPSAWTNWWTRHLHGEQTVVDRAREAANNAALAAMDRMKDNAYEQKRLDAAYKGVIDAYAPPKPEAQTPATQPPAAQATSPTGTPAGVPPKPVSPAPLGWTWRLVPA